MVYFFLYYLYFQVDNCSRIKDFLNNGMKKIRKKSQKDIKLKFKFILRLVFSKTL